MPTLDLSPTLGKEPVSIAEAIHATFGTISQAAFIAEAAQNYQKDPETWNPLGICRHCGTSLGDSEADKVITLAGWGFLANVCCKPCSEAGKARLEDEDRQARDQNLSGIIPAEFISWDSSKGNAKLLATVNGAFSFTDRRGILIHGASGQCKTRILWRLIRTICEQPENFTWLMLDAFEASSKGIPAEAFKVDFLFIDDLGNEPKNAKWETGLLHLIRRRCDWHKPIFITTQLTGQMFKNEFFSGSAASAILRRLTERTAMISA